MVPRSRLLLHTHTHSFPFIAYNHLYHATVIRIKPVFDLASQNNRKTKHVHIPIIRSFVTYLADFILQVKSGVNGKMVSAK